MATANVAGPVSLKAEKPPPHAAASQGLVRKEGANIRGLFGDIASRYDFLNHFLSLNVDRLWRRRAVRELALAQGAKVLDVCTGTADLAIELSRAVRRDQGGFVIGTDFTPEMLRIGLAKTRRQSCGHGAPHGTNGSVSLCLADTLCLPFPDASFDAVTVAFGIRNVESLEGALSEMRRVLKPGGSVAILEFARPRNRALRGLFELYFRHILPRLGGWIAGSRRAREAYTYLPASVGEFLPPEELARQLEQAGFHPVRYLGLTQGIAYLHIATRSAREDGG